MSAESATPWVERALTTTGLSPARAGLALALAAVALFGLLELLLGRFAIARLPGDPQAVIPGMWVAVTHILVTAYLVAATAAAGLGVKRTVERIDGLAAGGPYAIGWSSGDRFILRGAGIFGLVCAAAVTTLSPGEAVSMHPATWTAETAWHRILAYAIGFLILRFSTLLILLSLKLSQLADGIRELDLLDLAVAAPFARQGLANALLVAGLVAVYALFLVDLRYLTVAIPVLSFTAVVATFALLLPVQGIRRRIRREKQAELAWCRDQMRRGRRALAEGGRPAGGAGMDEWVAYEARIQSVREWPLDSATLSRFGLYLALPLGSWAGGALVERAIDALLD